MNDRQNLDIAKQEIQTSIDRLQEQKLIMLRQLGEYYRYQKTDLADKIVHDLDVTDAKLDAYKDARRLLALV